jgi:hypothetical protein
MIKNLIQNETAPSIRKIVLRLIGSIGAVDPYLIKQIHLYYHNDARDGELAENVPFLKEIDNRAQKKAITSTKVIEMPKIFPKPAEPVVSKEYDYPTMAIK